MNEGSLDGRSAYLSLPLSQKCGMGGAKDGHTTSQDWKRTLKKKISILVEG